MPENENFSYSIHLLSSSFIYEDITSFNFFDNTNTDIYNWFSKPTEVINYKYDSNGILKYTINKEDINDKEQYILINDNYDNFIYRQYNGESTSDVQLDLITIKEQDGLTLFWLDDDLIYNDYTHTNLDTYQITDETEIEDNKNITYLTNGLEKAFGGKNLLYSESSNNNVTFFYLNFNAEAGISNSFNIDDYIYELRINSIPTKFFTVSKASKKIDNDTSSSIYNLRIKINSELFKKVNGLDDMNFFIFTIKNKYINEHKSFYYSKVEDTIRPFISYDPMVETNNDININCRFDLSLLTTDQTNDVIVDINNEKLITTINNRKKPVVDNNIIFDFTGDPTINIMALGKSIVRMSYNTNNSSDEMYIISKKDLNFKNENYKVTCDNTKNLILGTNSYILCKREGYNEIYFQVDSIKDVSSKMSFTFPIRFFKINQEKYKSTYGTDDIIIDELGKDEMPLLWTHKKNIITVNFKVNINASQKYEYSEDEKEILDNILTFQTDIINSNFGESSIFSLKANDNITLNDSDLNSESLKQYIKNGGRDLTTIEENNENFDITFYGIYVDHMIMDNSEIGEIYINRINDITEDTDSLQIISQRLVCNASESDYTDPSGKEDFTDRCKDGFNENAFMETVDGVDKRILIVPEDAYNLFNFLNGEGYSGVYSFKNTSEEIYEMDEEEYIDKYKASTSKKENASSFALYPYADLVFRANDNEESTFEKANLYIDYYPVKHRLTKVTNGNIIWSIYVGTQMNSMKFEKIMKLVVNEKQVSEEDESIITDETGSINDSNSTITYPSFVTFKILMETDGNDPSSIDGAKYIGKITNVSELPVLIKDISLENFAEEEIIIYANVDLPKQGTTATVHLRNTSSGKDLATKQIYPTSNEEVSFTFKQSELENIDLNNLKFYINYSDEAQTEKGPINTSNKFKSKLFKVNDDKTALLDESFMKYDIEGDSNYIKVDTINIANYANHNDITELSGNMFILKPGGTLNVNIYNNESISSIPENFGRSLNNLSDSLHYEIYYIQDNIEDDKSSIRYTFREEGSTEKTNFETVVNVYPLISSLNFDTDYYRYGETVLNPITKEIAKRSTVFRLIPKEDRYHINDQKYTQYDKFIDAVIDDPSTIDEDILYLDDLNILLLDLDNIYFLESGKTYSYEELLKKLRGKYPYKKDIINTAYGIQVITRTSYSSDDNEYDSVIISNYIDILNNPENIKPKLNRLTGSLYHLLTIENKHEDLYEYKILVDDKEYHEGDLIFNKYANEIALHKFRLYYRAKSGTINTIKVGTVNINEGKYKGYQFGDVNHDGIISYADLEALKQFLDFIKKYDLNNDGIVDSIDLDLVYKKSIEPDSEYSVEDILIIQKYLNGKTDFAEELADVNGDGIVDKNDLDLLEKYLSDFKNTNNIGKEIKVKINDEIKTRYIGNFDLYFDEDGNEHSYSENSQYLCIADSKFDVTDLSIPTNKKIYLESNYQKTCGEGEITINGDLGAGFSDVRCLQEYIEYLTNHPDVQPSELALLLGDVNNDGILDQNDVLLLDNFIKEHGYLVGDVDNNQIINNTDKTIIDKFYNYQQQHQDKTFEEIVTAIEEETDSKYSKNFRVWDTTSDDILNRITNLDAAWVNSYSQTVANDNVVDYRTIFKDIRVGKYLLEVPYTEVTNYENYDDDWILADSFEGCIDGTKPIVPNLIIDKLVTKDENNYSKILHKYSTLTRDELKNILYNPENILNEVNYYDNVNILTNISYNMTYEIVGTAGISKLRVPDREENDGTFVYKVLASDLVKGKFQIVNTTTEPLNIEINQRIINDEASYPFVITSDAPLSHTTPVNEYQPIFRLEPNAVINFYVQFNENIRNYETLLDIRVENNYKKKYTDENVKWDNYTIKLVNQQEYKFNEEIIMQLLPYSFYVENDSDYEYADYYDINNSTGTSIDSNKIFNVIDVNNFNRNSLYSTNIYFDNVLIYDSSVDKSKDDYKLLISKKVLDRKMYIGDHTITVITNKFNGLMNYQNYYITLIDHNIYNKNGKAYKDYFRDRDISDEEKMNMYRKSIIPRHPRNEGYNTEEFLNELFLDSSGNVSMVTKDYSSKSENYYLYKFTEILQHYMCLSDFIVDSDQYLFEKNYQEVLNSYNICKNEYDSYMNNIYSKLNKTSGEIYTIMNNIEYYFDNFEMVLSAIKKQLEDSEANADSSSTSSETEKNTYDDNTKFISKLFYNDELLFRYKTFNVLYSPDQLNNDYKISINLLNEISGMQGNDTVYIYDKDIVNMNINKVVILPMDVNMNNSDEITIIENSGSVSIAGEQLEIYISNLVDTTYRNLCVLISISMNNQAYYFKVNLYNAENTLKLNDNSDIKFSYLDKIERTIINTSNMTISFKLQGENGKVIKLNDKSKDVKLIVETDTVGTITDNEEITLPPYMSCKFTFSGKNTEDIDIIRLISTLKNWEPPTATTQQTTEDPIIQRIKDCQDDILKIPVTFKITNVDIDESNSIYKYIYVTDTTPTWPSFSMNLLYFPLPTVFLSEFSGKNIIKNITVGPYLEITGIGTVGFFMMVNDDPTNNYCGHFAVNNVENIAAKNGKVIDYLPFRKNKLQPNFLRSDNASINFKGTSYDNCYSLDSIYDSNGKIKIEQDRVFPIFIQKKNDSTDLSYSLTKVTLENTLNKREFSDINLTYEPSTASVTNKLSFMSLTDPTLKYGDIEEKIHLGSIITNPQLKTYYATYIDNTTEYITNYLNNYDINDKDDNNQVYYIYPVKREETPATDTPSSSITASSSYTPPSVIPYGNNIEFKEISRNIIPRKFFRYMEGKISFLQTTLFDALNNPSIDGTDPRDHDNEYYSSIIYKINYVGNNDFSEIFTNLRGKIQQIYSLKSKIAIIKQNMAIQNEQLNEKATVKEFKEWVNENVFAFAEFEYLVSEMYSDFYYLSNKGMDDINVIKTNTETGNQTTITLNLNNSYPIINRYRYLDNSNAQFIFAALDIDLERGESYITPNIWLTEKGNHSTNYFNKKFWLSLSNNQTDVAIVNFKRNFIDTSNLLHTDFNSNNTIQYYKQS